jgi:hypothetical protein
MLDFGLYSFYVLLLIAVVVALIFPVITSLSNPRSLIGSGVAILGFVVLFALSYAVSDAAISNAGISAGLGESEVKLIGAGLIMFYIVLALAVLALIYSEISKALK